ncbi:MAG TPA: PilZ domain-containing protein [Allosphingosinicella sp.]|jgi:hypothetical protein
MVNFASRMRDSDSSGMDVAVIDLSAGGCRIAPAGEMEIGQIFWLKLPGFEARHCHILWLRDAEAGCEFAQPLTDDEYEALSAPLRKVVRAETPGAFGRRR